MKTYCLGSKVFVDQIAVDKIADLKACPHVHTLYDLEKHRNMSWYSPDSSAGCSSGTFSGDWGDPFGSIDDLAGQATKYKLEPTRFLDSQPGSSRPQVRATQSGHG